MSSVRRTRDPASVQPFSTMKTNDSTQFTEPASDAGGRSSMPASVAQVEELLVEAQCAPVRIGPEALLAKDCSWVAESALAPRCEGETPVQFRSQRQSGAGIYFGIDVAKPGSVDATALAKFLVDADGSYTLVEVAYHHDDMFQRLAYELPRFRDIAESSPVPVAE